MKPSSLQTVTTTACAVIAAVALIVMAVFVSITQRQIDTIEKAAADAQEAVELVVAQRNEARETVCLKDQRFAQAHNRLVMALATGAGAHEVRPEDQAAVDANTVPVPDCSPQGIEDFYAQRNAEQQQPDGVVGASVPTTSTTVARTPSTVRRTTTTRAPATTGAPPTTFHSSPETTDPGCVVLPGVTLPPEVPCL